MVSAASVRDIFSMTFSPVLELAEEYWIHKNEIGNINEERQQETGRNRRMRSTAGPDDVHSILSRCITS